MSDGVAKHNRTCHYKKAQPVEYKTVFSPSIFFFTGFLHREISQQKSGKVNNVMALINIDIENNRTQRLIFH